MSECNRCEQEQCVCWKVSAYDSLKSQLEIAERALEFYAAGEHVDRPDFKNGLIHDEVIDDGDVARDALEMIAETRKV